MVRTGLGEKLLNFAEATFGSMRSGFGTSTVMGCGLFACISGSDAADAAAVGRLTMDRLVERGYPKPYACALVASGACTGILIPPSIAYIIIGLVLGVSASTLFLAAFIPGVLVLVAVMVTNAVINRVKGYEQAQGRFDLQRWLRALWDAKYALAIPFIILGGIYSGVFTPTESAAVAVSVAVGTGFIQKRLHPGRLPGDARHLGTRVRRGDPDHRGGAAVLAGADRAERAAAVRRLGDGLRHRPDGRDPAASWPSSRSPACSWKPGRTSSSSARCCGHWPMRWA